MNKKIVLITCLIIGVFRVAAQLPTSIALTVDGTPSSESSLLYSILLGFDSYDPYWSDGQLNTILEIRRGRDAAWLESVTVNNQGEIIACTGGTVTNFQAVLTSGLAITVGPGSWAFSPRLTIEHCKKSIRYDFRVYARSAATGLRSPPSNIQSVQFDNTADVNRPTIAPLPSTSSITTNSAVVSWGVGEANLTNSVEYRLDAGARSTVAASSTTTPSASLTALTAGGVYNYIAQSLDLSGNLGQASSNFTTVNTVSGNWSRRFGGTGNDSGKAMTVDASGNTFITGYFQGQVDFTGNGTGQVGTTKLTALGLYDMFVAKYSSVGVLQWVNQYGGAGATVNPNAIGVDNAGNIIVGGAFDGTVDFVEGVYFSLGTATSDLFLAKYSSAGTPVWLKKFGNANNDIFTGMAVNKLNGDIVFAGTFQGAVDYSGTTFNALSSYYGGVDCFLAKYSTDGVHSWSKNFNNIGTDVINCLVVDATGNLYLAGTITGGFINVGGSDLQNPNTDPTQSTSAMFLAKLNSAGTHLYSEDYNDANPVSMALSASGTSIIVAGGFGGSASVGGSTMTDLGSQDSIAIFLASYNSSFTHVWSQSIGGIGDERVAQVAVDSSGNIILLAHFYYQTSMYPIQGGHVGGLTINSAGGVDFVLAKYLSTGAHSWSAGYGGIGNDTSFGLAVDSTGKITSLGRFQVTATFVGVPLTSAGGSDVVLFQHAP